MIVLDASAALEWLLRHPAASRVEQRISEAGEWVLAPHLLDVEILQVVRRLVGLHAIDDVRAAELFEDFAGLRIVRCSHRPFSARIWELRANLTACDAAYVAVAESFDAVLLTHDARLARTSGHRAQVELV
jgi:predicted nucleic acid-binding protein